MISKISLSRFLFLVKQARPNNMRRVNAFNSKTILPNSKVLFTRFRSQRKQQRGHSKSTKEVYNWKNNTYCNFSLFELKSE